MLNRLYESSFACKFTTGLNTDPEAQKLRRAWMMDPMLMLVKSGTSCEFSAACTGAWSLKAKMSLNNYSKVCDLHFFKTVYRVIFF